MNHGVEILIARMKSNPEDFDYDGRFSTYGNALADLAGGSQRVRRAEDPAIPFYFLTEEDRTALVEAWNERMREGFAQGVMKTLMEDPKPADEAKQKSTRVKFPTSQQAQLNIAAQQAQYDANLRMQAMNNAYNAQQNQLQGGLGGLGAVAGGFFK
jgi:hypothetical protein